MGMGRGKSEAASGGTPSASCFTQIPGLDLRYGSLKAHTSFQLDLP
jgi:hypothetical protein